MALLAHNSTGNEEGDKTKAESLLDNNKKAVMLVSGCEQDVRGTIGRLFRQVELKSLTRISHDPLTLAELWQCELRRDPSKIGNHTREREREAKHLHLIEMEKGKPMTATEFAEQLKKVAFTLRLKSFDPSDISPIILQQWLQKAEKISDSEKSFEHFRGILAEKIVPLFLRKHLEELCKTVETMYAWDVLRDLQDSTLQVCQGTDPDQVVFSLGNEGVMRTFLEVDALYRTATTKEYIALDVTTGHSKMMHTQKRNEKLKILSAALNREIILIDVVLTNGSFSFEQNESRIHRWKLPCTIDFRQLLSTIVPRTSERALWGQYIGPYEKFT